MPETLTAPQHLDQQFASPDRNPLEKLEFRDIEPRFSDTVYHVTKNEHMDDIAKEGLTNGDMWELAPEAATADWRLMMDKPDDIPVDLEHTVYGQLETRHLGTNRSGGALRTNTSEGELLAIAVDPKDSYVGDARIREELISVESYESRWGTGQEIRKMFWDNCLPLKVFKELYEPASKEGDDWQRVNWQLKDPANEEKLGLRNSFEFPEVYIPLEAGQDSVPVDRLAHVAGSRVGRGAENT